MTAEELWKKSGLEGKYEAWAFGGAPDKLAKLVLKGIKTATCSAYELYQVENEPIPQVGDYSVILDSKDNAVCIIQTTKIYIAPYSSCSKEHAYKEGEGDRSLQYWKDVHKEFFTDEMKSINKSFDENMLLIYEEFVVVYK
ncbi:MAG: ASCH domain-containing protein [Erysipelotrichaceae bacterium]|nr:ASCH domain-containing protein [Erysipelotrichaceae bacterium]